MILKYPNKPNELWPDSLQALDDGDDSYCEQKLDGWRCFCFRDKLGKLSDRLGAAAWVRKGDLYFVSRRDQNKGGPTNFTVSDDIVDCVHELRLPDQTMLDCEWCERRTKEDNIPECLYMFDILWLDDVWLGNSACWDRHETLRKFSAGKRTDYLRMPDYVEHGFVPFYERQKQISHTEGVVIKERGSIVRANLTGCQKTGSWIKIKWRRGHDGRERV